MAQWKPQPKIIKQKSPNQPVILYQGFGEIIDSETIIEGTSLVKISWYPFPSVTVDFTYQGEGKIELGDIELKLTELIPQERIKVHLYEHTHYGNGENKISAYLTETFIKGKTEELSSVTFHLANFFWFNTSNYYDFEYDDKGNEKEIQRESWLDFEGQLIFDYENWHIVLGTLEEAYDLQEKMQIQGGYGVTHICKLERLDNTQFSLDEGYEIINAFVYYLSFVRGFLLSPLFVSGFDLEGNYLFEEWRTPTTKADSWQSLGYSWADPDSTEIVDIFSGFMKRWQDSTWKEVVQNSIQWYIESFQHHTGYNTSIILIQAALEKLSWTYLKTNECVTSDGFGGLKASGQIRLLLKFLNIDLIPITCDNYPQVKAEAKGRNWIDSLQAIAEVRNAIVHPSTKGEKKAFSLSEQILQETFSIGHKYLLSCLLKLFEHPLV